MSNNDEPKLSRLVIVSNRLPFEMHQENGKISTVPGSGGLITALAPILRDRGGLWTGWVGPHAEIDSEQMRKVIQDASQTMGFDFNPISLTKEEVERYYYGFSNEIIWPLFHGLISHCNFLPLYWQAYKSVNEKFTDTLMKCLRPSDFLWVHDYHLMLLGQQLRKKQISNKIAFFLHIPFPPVDIFLKLPWRFALIEALLCFDLVGFQTSRDSRNFIQCVRAIHRDVAVKNLRTLHTCTFEGREVKVGAFPISIDYRDFSKVASSQDIAKEAWFLHEKWPEQRMILSIDRLDYTKGILQRLEAIRCFLITYPEFHKKICFVQIVIPSRADIPEYLKLKQEIDRLVGEINSQFACDHWVPIHYMFRSIPKHELLAYYRTCEVALITPIMDGLNLVSKEYLACNIEENGVLILSEFAGAAAQLYSGAILINPFDIEGVAQALYKALTMESDERKKRMRMLRRMMKRYDIFWWTKTQLNAAFGKELKDFPVLPMHMTTEESQEKTEKT